MASGWSLDNPVFCQFIFYASVLALKMVFMSMITGLTRLRKSVFANPEDAANLKGKVIMGDDEVERTRRAHLNDLENIPAFWFLGLLYVLTDPSPYAASMCFRLFTFVRFQHTISYLLGIFRLRALGFLIGMLINVYMGTSTMLYFM